MEVTNVCPAQHQRVTFRWRTAALGRRHSNDGTLNPGPGSVASQVAGEPDCFHPYRRQYSDGARQQPAPCLPQCPPPYGCFQEVADHCVTRSLSSDALSAWDQCNYSFEASELEGSPTNTYPEHPAAPLDPVCFLTQNRSLCPAQVSLVNSRSTSPQYSHQGLSASSHQDSSATQLFPKPIYSYSILIFMALKNSKTGSLPVSEIYNFITEQFPYFKTAPDGWKNSVRHNLSLNKCFEKVENQAGNASRKGCLWALNPAKVEKMQEEMNKWRRKDPASVRKCMARPEDHDRLFGDRGGPPHRSPPILSSTSSRNYSSGLRPHKPRAPHRRTPARRPPSPPRPCYPSPLPGSFPLYSLCSRQPLPGGPTGLVGGGLCLPAACAVGPGSMRDLLLEGEGVYDVDTLNPSLTDLQLHGNLWEELKEDSLVPDCLANVTIPDISLPPGDTHIGAQKVMTSVSQKPEVIHIDLARSEEEEEEEEGKIIASGFSLEQHINGLYPMVYSGAECLAGYLTSCATPMPFL